MEKIQKNLPMPKPVGAGRPTKYPWNTMEVGDSFALPTLDYNTALAYCSGASRRYKKQFKTRFYKGEYRIWRTK